MWPFKKNSENFNTLNNTSKNDGASIDDENGNCKQCGHPFDPHLLIAEDANNPLKGGIIKCPVAHCACHSTWDFKSNKMNEIEIYKFIRNGLYDLIHSIDPAALGGATGEYDKDIDAIIKLIMLKKSELSVDEIKLIFSKAYKEYSLDEDEIGRIILKIRNIVKELYK